MDELRDAVQAAVEANFVKLEHIMPETDFPRYRTVEDGLLVDIRKLKVIPRLKNYWKRNMR